MCNKNFMLSAFLFPCSKIRGFCKSFLICLLVLVLCLFVSGCSSKEGKREAANTKNGHFDEQTSSQEPAAPPDTNPEIWMPKRIIANPTQGPIK